VNGDGPDELRAQLRSVDDELEGLRRTAEELREQIGDRSDGATDPAERAAVITAAEEQEGLIGVQTTRREGLLRRLSGGTAQG
jgi:hypothetical protein